MQADPEKVGSQTLMIKAILQSQIARVYEHSME